MMENLGELSRYETVLMTKLPKVTTMYVPNSKDYLVREFDYRNDYLAKLGFYNEDGQLIW